MKLILTGATGLSGAEVLRQALLDPYIETIYVLTRKSLGFSNPKVVEVMINDFTDYAAVAVDARSVDACIWCLGVSQTAVEKDEYIQITFDYTMAAARTFFAANPDMRFCFLSGQGADPTEKALSLFGKIKGRTERHLLELSRNHVFNFRPGYIQPSTARAKPRVTEKIANLLTPFANKMSDGFSVTSAQLAKCLLGVAKNGANQSLFDNAAIKKY